MLHKLKNWTQSATGADIALLSSLPLDQISSYRPLLFIGGVHGDEPEGVFLAAALSEWLKSHNSPLKNHWIVIPCLNVDGYANQQRTNHNGVDLNRNFPSQDWSQEAKAPRYFPGPHKGSEPEVQALVALTEAAKPRIMVHFHSWKPAVICSCSTDHPAAQFLAESSGYPLQEDIGYPTPGSLGQWGWLDLGIPVICTEEREGADQNETWTHFGPGLQKMFLQEVPLPLK